jgi:hypothetical protein
MEKRNNNYYLRLAFKCHSQITVQATRGSGAMQATRSSLFSYYALIFIVGGNLAGCVSLRPITEETFTFEPDRTATVFGENRNETFGICNPFTVDRRGTRLYTWPEFVRQRTSPDYRVRNLAGYDVGVSRGESCHQRVFETFQAAAHFDLSTLPDGAAITSAELRVHRFFSPLDPPYSRGSAEQCTVLLIGQATGAWAPGIYRVGTASGPRPLIPSRPARPRPGPYNALGSSSWNVDVTQTVSEWVRGGRANQGFVITPDIDKVEEFYKAADEVGFMCDVGITGFELVVTAAVPE